jgi:succinate dehydrogenase / fumarate reductase cytochrome b subunit
MEFNTAVKAISYAPFVVLLEIFVIAIPILFHAIYGIFIAMEMQGPGGNVSFYGYQRNWLYVLQRWSGVLALFYILFHTYDTTFTKYFIELNNQGEVGHALGFNAISFDAMAWRMASPAYLTFQILGVAAAAFHLGNGLLNFAIRWGIAIGREAQRIAAALGWVLGVALTVLGALIAINFAVHGQPLRQQYSTLDQLIHAELDQQKAVSQSTLPGSKVMLSATR